MRRPQKISHLFWQNSCFYSVASKEVGDFFQIFVAFSEKLNFSYKIFCCSYFSKEGRSLGRISLVDFILNISTLSTKLIKEIQIQELFFQYWFANESKIAVFLDFF